MNTKQAVWGGMVLGSLAGSLFAGLFGGGTFSFSSLILSALGAILGIYIAFKLSQR
jgi:hypothetical protein